MLTIVFKWHWRNKDVKKKGADTLWFLSLVSTIPAGFHLQMRKKKCAKRVRVCWRGVTLWINCPSCWKYTSPGSWHWIINSNLSEKEWEKSIDGETGPLMVSLKGRLPMPGTSGTSAGGLGELGGGKVLKGDTWPPNDFLSLYHKHEGLTCPSTPHFPLALLPNKPCV